jgi:hypothetical protein
MNKLKEENMLLKEALEKANASDITMLKSKLRGSHADLVRLRQNNSELKDRIQILEGRLFSALSLQTTKNSNIIDNAQDTTKSLDLPTTNTSTVDGTTILDSRFTSSERAHLMDMVKSLQTRCKHLARLVQSYESKISIMQSEADARAAASASASVTDAKESSQTIEFNVVEQEGPVAMTSAELTPALKSALKGSTGKPYSSSVSKTSAGRKQVHMDEDEVAARIAKAREGDLKVVRELLEEVKRLVALLPRGNIDVAEPPDSTGGAQADEEEERDASEDEKLSRPVSKGSSSSAAAKLPSQSSISEAGAAGRVGDVTHHEMYSPGQLLCSFFAGVVVMLLCVALSTYGVYYATAGDEAGAGSSSPLHRGGK